MPEVNGSSACICEICNCGRHKCPHYTRLQKPIHECVITEYTENFQPREYAKVNPILPKRHEHGNQGKISDVTTHKTDFQPYPPQEKYVHRTATYVPNETQFQGLTMYNETFTPKNIDPVKPIIRANQRQTLGKFEGEPTYKSDYKKWNLEGTKREYAIPGSNISRPTETFEGIPTYKTDFLGHVASPPASFKPQSQYTGPSGTFQDETDYKKSYVPYEIDRQKAFKPDTQWHKPEVPIEGITTHHADFTEKYSAPMNSFKPLNKPVNISGAALSSVTTNRADYKPWQMERTLPIHRENEYSAPAGNFQGDTTYFNDFIPYRAERTQPIKHADNRTQVQGPFNGESSYKIEYKKWNSELTRPILPHGMYEPNRVPFEGESTFKSHYVPYEIPHTKSCKPEANTSMPTEPFHGDTSYRCEFTPKRNERCPASLLDSQYSNFVFKRQDPDTGHKFYSVGQKTTSGLNRSIDQMVIA